MTSQNLWNMSLFEHFFKVLSLYLKARIRIWILIKMKGTRVGSGSAAKWNVVSASKWYGSATLDPDPLVRGTDPGFRIRIKMSWIPTLLSSSAGPPPEEGGRRGQRRVWWRVTPTGSQPSERSPSAPPASPLSSSIHFLDFFRFFVLYSTLLYLPPLRFYCVWGCWDRTRSP